MLIGKMAQISDFLVPEMTEGTSLTVASIDHGFLFFKRHYSSHRLIVVEHTQDVDD
jgi:hypothetical protein